MAKICPQCWRQLPKSAPEESAEHCTVCSRPGKGNTNRQRGEDRNQSFGGESHEKQAKGNRSQSHR